MHWMIITVGSSLKKYCNNDSSQEIEYRNCFFACRSRQGVESMAAWWIVPTWIEDCHTGGDDDDDANDDDESAITRTDNASETVTKVTM